MRTYEVNDTRVQTKNYCIVSALVLSPNGIEGFLAKVKILMPKLLFVFLFVVFFGILKAAPGVISNHPITPPITDKGVVRVIFHVLGDSVSGGVVICQDSMYNPDPTSSHPPISWKFLAGIVRLNNLSEHRVGNDSIDFFKGDWMHGKGNYTTGMQTMLWAKGDTFCAWFEIDVLAKTHSVYLQQKSDQPNEIIKCAENYPTRNQLFTEINMVQSIGNIYNNKPYGVEVIEAVRVYGVGIIYDPPNNISQKKQNNSHLVYPTVVKDVLCITSESEINKVKIYDLAGNLLIESTTDQIDLSSIVPGTYVVSISDIIGAVSQTKIIKN